MYYIILHFFGFAVAPPAGERVLKSQYEIMGAHIVSTFGQWQQCAYPALSRCSCTFLSNGFRHTHSHTLAHTLDAHTHALHARLLSAANLCFQQQLRAIPFFKFFLYATALLDIVVVVAASVVAVAASVVCAVDGLSDFPNFCTLASEFCFPQPLSKAAAAAAHNGHVKRHMEPKLESQSQQALQRGQKGAWLLPKVVALTIRAFEGFFSICGLCFSASCECKFSTLSISVTIKHT